MKALIYNGRVVQVAEEAFEVYDGLTWIECVGMVTVGDTYADGIFTSANNNVTIDEYKITIKNKIDIIVGDFRTKYLTVIPGQDLIYWQKDVQARTYKALGYSGEVPPLVESDATVFGITPQEAADNIITISNQWMVIAKSTEEKRLGYKLSVDACNSIIEIDGIWNTVLESFK